MRAQRSQPLQRQPQPSFRSRFSSRNNEAARNPLATNPPPCDAQNLPQGGVKSRAQSSLVGTIAYAMHGLFFLSLAIASLIYVRQLFFIVGLCVAGISLVSLRQAWLGFTDYLAKRRAK